VPIPLDVADLTSEWFSDALDTPVRSVEVVDAHSGTTGRAKVRLDSGGALPTRCSASSLRST
jgi:hypothetical protein